MEVINMTADRKPVDALAYIEAIRRQIGADRPERNKPRGMFHGPAYPLGTKLGADRVERTLRELYPEAPEADLAPEEGGASSMRYGLLGDSR